ncbi:hypothetical protein [Frondihabitans sp. Leaf304]|uniref:hypothetical protein n=1 Tax=Frondihabitans sp. Leaf304 TaxID=1736329 RepID=UPI0012FAE8D7|nr:hypothetical protein [Frondihabitans sp. Leaf304]
MDPKTLLALMFGVSAALPLCGIGWSIAEGVKERTRLKVAKPGTLAEFNLKNEAAAGLASRRSLVLSPVRDLAFVGGGVVVASIAGILSLYIL